MSCPNFGEDFVQEDKSSYQEYGNFTSLAEYEPTNEEVYINKETINSISNNWLIKSESAILDKINIGDISYSSFTGNCNEEGVEHEVVFIVFDDATLTNGLYKIYPSKEERDTDVIHILKDCKSLDDLVKKYNFDKS